MTKSNEVLDEILTKDRATTHGKDENVELVVMEDGNLDSMIPLKTAILAWHEQELLKARLDEIERSDYLFNKNLGSQHKVKERVAELKAALKEQESEQT